MEKWRIIVSLDRPCERIQKCLKDYYQMLLRIDMKAKWAVHKDFGGDHHFMIVWCDENQADLLEQDLLSHFLVK